MLVKQIMTGALGILKPGTPIQVGLAVLTMFIYLMVLLRFTPFRSSADDMLAYISTLATLILQCLESRPHARDPGRGSGRPRREGSDTSGVSHRILLVLVLVLALVLVLVLVLVVVALVLLVLELVLLTMTC